VKSTVGAGDALFAAFLHFRSRHPDPVAAMRRAVVLAGWKAGAASGGAGFLAEDRVKVLCAG
jgi:sugar/nucleoside kinase (ribokinase family)